MRVVFAGTPVFAARALEALLASRHEVVAVLSQPDRPSGRGQKLVASPVKQVAVAAGLPVYQPHTLRVRPAPQTAGPTTVTGQRGGLNGAGPHVRNAGAADAPESPAGTARATAAGQGHAAPETDEQRRLREARNQEALDTHAALRALNPDVMVVAAYGLLLPQTTLDLPRFGCLNIHASLLPRWRGAAPIQRAIEAGDAETGVGIMQMEAGLDTGPVGLERRTPISATDTAATLHDRLAGMGAEAIVAALDALAAGTLGFTPQAVEGVTYAAKIEKAQLRVDWSRPAHEVACHIRAFDPPGATTRLEGAEDPTAQLRVFDPVVLDEETSIALQRAHGQMPHDHSAADGRKVSQVGDAFPASVLPGTILQAGAAGVDVTCGDGRVLRLQALQRPGGRRQPADVFLRGHPLPAGARFTSESGD